ncbi:MAG TPA: hypothetical protein PKH07_16560 [bacterium]|nr:hypothetical protein [bacterium]
MRKVVRVTWPGIFLLLFGCIPSLHPLYTEEDLIFDPALVGIWANEDSGESWTFTKTSEKEYKTVYIDNSKAKGEFSGHLVKSGDCIFLDLYPSKPELDENDFYKIHLIPVHTFLLVRQVEPKLQMAILKPDALKKVLTANPDAIKHEKVEDGVLLTAQPKELQAFLVNLAKTAENWEDMDFLPRKVLETTE